MRTRITLVFFLISKLVFAQDGGESKPQVLILTTGGTIGSRTDAPVIDGPALVQAVVPPIYSSGLILLHFFWCGSARAMPTRLEGLRCN